MDARCVRPACACRLHTWVSDTGTRRTGAKTNALHSKIRTAAMRIRRGASASPRAHIPLRGYGRRRTTQHHAHRYEHDQAHATVTPRREASLAIAGLAASECRHVEPLSVGLPGLALRVGDQPTGSRSLVSATGGSPSASPQGLAFPRPRTALRGFGTRSNTAPLVELRTLWKDRHRCAAHSSLAYAKTVAAGVVRSGLYRYDGRSRPGQRVK